MDIPESVVEFYEAAKNLWEKADSIKACDENNVEELLKALVVLHLKALYLPNFELIATIKIVDTHLDGSFPSCLCPKNLKAIKASCVFGASAAEKAPRPAVCRQF